MAASYWFINNPLDITSGGVTAVGQTEYYDEYRFHTPQFEGNPAKTDPLPKGNWKGSGYKQLIFPAPKGT